ncbi:hypothetical protein RclHR1_02230017 [Rhizophagus clarus]|uniref:Uncharacterized protein n=1 Tax=Rhizophagus clarus TaxID=94130 RepID=A0A2Z6RA22_9GLOM|nr:hypothetical protein RclHR1_02230017 [Rhizophagus clarus]GES75601.1 hypothetical protein RCL_jg9129.t1 [Rhizophagus clarus]
MQRYNKIHGKHFEGKIYNILIDSPATFFDLLATYETCILDVFFDFDYPRKKNGLKLPKSNSQCADVLCNCHVFYVTLIIKWTVGLWGCGMYIIRIYIYYFEDDDDKMNYIGNDVWDISQ